MSSPFSSFGGVPTSFCQCCQRPLPSNIVQCGYCGYNNSSVQRNDLTENIPPSSQAPWNVNPPQIGNTPNQYNNSQMFQSGNTLNQYSNSQWGQMSFSHPQQLSFPDNNQSTSVPQAFYNAFSNQGQVNDFLPGFITPPQTPEISQSVPVERRRLNMKKVVGLVVVLLILIGGSIAGYIVLTLQQGAKHPTAPGYPVPKGPPLFAESFKNNNEQWDMQSMQGKYLVSIKKENLILEDDDNKLLPVLLPGDKHFDNYKLIVDAVLSKGDRQNGYGLCIRGTTDPNGYLTAYYRIELYGNGAYAVFKVATDANGNTSSTTLTQPTAHTAINLAGHINQIVVIANGPKITLVVNGQTVQTFSDTSYASGVVALFVSNVPDTHPGAQAMFSHLAIYPVNAK